MSEERTVNLVDISQKEAETRFEQESRQVGGAVAGIEQAVIQFTKINDFTTFKVEYAWVDGDLVIHFFLTAEMIQLNKTTDGGPAVKNYWIRTFPLALDKASKEYFQADKPRLQAKYTEELASWYFRAQGYGDRIDPDRFAETFFDHLDQALESQEKPGPGH